MTAVRDFDPTKHPKYPAGTEGGKGGEWMPKGGAAEQELTEPSADWQGHDTRAMFAYMTEEGDPQNPLPDWMTEQGMRDLIASLGPYFSLAALARPGDVRPTEDEISEAISARQKAQVCKSIAADIEAEYGKDWYANLGLPEDQRRYIEDGVSRALSHWAFSAGDAHTMSILMQLLMQDEFQTESDLSHLSATTTIDDDEEPYETRPAYITAKALFDTNAPTAQFYRAVIRTMYKRTQADLAARGIKSVVLVRGSWEYDGREGTFKAYHQPISSWSINSDEARTFGPTVATRVPASWILSTPRTGFGCLNEYEAVVIGRKPFEVQSGVGLSPGYYEKRDFDPAKHPKYPAGAEVEGEHVGGRWMPKDGETDLGPELSYGRWRGMDDTTAYDFISRGEWGAYGLADDDKTRELKDSIARRLGDRLIEEKGLGWFAENSEFTFSRSMADPVDRGLVPNRGTYYEYVLPREWREMTAEERMSLLQGESGSNIVYQAMSNIVHQWARSSGDNSPSGVLMQLAIQKEFGTGVIPKYMGADTLHGGNGETVLDWAKKALPNAQPFLSVFLRTMYAETQSQLRERGITSFVLYRGFADAEKVNSGRVQMRRSMPASAWSADHEEGIRFAHMRARNRPGRKPYLLTATVPASRILGTPRTGFGCTGEWEYVVVGADGEYQLEALAANDSEVEWS